MAIRLEMKGNKKYSIDKVADEIKDELSGEFVSLINRDRDDYKIRLITYEKYYVRTNSFTALNILLQEDDEGQIANVISFGGGQGFLNFSYGVEKGYLEEVEEILEEMGFKREFRFDD